MRFRPCIDLHGGKVKQIVGGTLTDDSIGLVENFVSEHDSAYYARMFRTDGLTGGHVIMLGPGNEEEAVKALREYPGGLQVGGGITPENASRYLEAGASHVIVTSYIFRDGELDPVRLSKLVAEVGRARLVLDLSCRRRAGSYYVVTNRWQRFSSLEITQAALASLSESCDELLIHAADVEGLRRGVDAELVKLLGEWATIPVTYAGGIRSLADLELIRKIGQDRLDATVGSALDIFGGDLPYREVVQWSKRYSE